MTMDLDFSLVNCDVKWLFRGGIRVKDVLKFWRAILTKFQPEAIFLLVGDNDIGGVKNDNGIEELVALIEATASVLVGSQIGAKKVFVSQMMPRLPARPHIVCRWQYDPEYNGRAVKLNAVLKSAF